MKESTRSIARMHGWRIDRTAHNWIYFVFYAYYVRLFIALGNLVKRVLGGVFLGSRLFRGVFDRYHAKIITFDDAVKILTLNEDVVVGPDPTEMIIPFERANKIILQEPHYIAVMDCPCRLRREDGCKPVDVCIAVGRMTAQFWLEHGRKYHARRITQDEALAIIRDARGRGNITTAWFKVATGGRTGVICCCCTCCCGGLYGMRLVREMKGGEDLSNMIASGYSVIHDAEACDACGTCAQTCFFEAVVIEGGHVVQSAELCMGCGLCVEACPAGARSLKPDAERGLPLDIDLLRAEIAGRRGGADEQKSWGRRSG